MSNITRHVGIDHLGNKLVVIFRELPEDPEHCLVVQSSTLPDIYHDNLMNVVESQESQQTIDLYEVLSRRVFGDGSPMLQTLHVRGLIKKMPVDKVNLIPMPNRKLPLREANAAISGNAPSQSSDAPSEQQNVQEQPVAPEQAEVKELTPEERAREEANNLITQARLMEADAKSKREKAYELCPDLKLGGRPSKKGKEAQKS